MTTREFAETFGISNGYEVKKAFDSNFKQVNSYHIDVYGVEL